MTIQALQDANAAGELSLQAMQAFNIPDIGSAIQAGIGISVDDVPASDVVLVTLLVDDSISMRYGSNDQVARDGFNLVVESLKSSKQKDNILVSCRYLSGRVLCPYIQLEQAPKMDATNYDPDLGNTPLLKQSVVVLGQVLTKTQEFKDNGVPVRSVTLLLTDGADNASYGTKAADVASIVTDMLRQENHIIAAMGIADGSTDFRAIFKGMGIEDKWILTPGNSQSEIRKAFQVFSQSAVRASQSAANFSKSAGAGLGGFGS